MESVALLSPTQRAELFSETAARMRMTPAVVEKDFWVCWTLGRLFSQPDLSRLLMFKGGTSLSKVFNLIGRFSEDIDLILDWQVVAGEDDPMAERSKAKQERLNTAIDREAQAYIANQLLHEIKSAIEPVCECVLAEDDPHAINVAYPAAFHDTYLRPAVLLEIGPLAAWLPHDRYQITPYAAEAFPKVFSEPNATVSAIRAERTFWEKATILHSEVHRAEGSPQPLRYSRHYYDMAMMAASPVKAAALADIALLEDVAMFKQRFYPRGWARYDLAKSGTLKLLPTASVLDSIRADYANMRNMIFGRYPDFDEIVKTLQNLEDEINALGNKTTT